MEAMKRTPLLDAHIHRIHATQTVYPPGWTYFSCAAGPADWPGVLADQSDTVHPFLGIHPEKIEDTLGTMLLERLEQLLADHNGTGIGEIGLDRRYYPGYPRPLQEKLLQAQLSLAARYGRPVILHQVRTLGTLLEQLGTLPDKVPVMIHGFRGNLDQVRQISNRGLYFSIGPGPHWETAAFRQSVVLIPRQRLLIESDWPYIKNLTSLSYRDTMENLYSVSAEAAGIDREELIRIVHSNGKVFTNRPVNRQGEKGNSSS